ncbi:AI-2E family transporter [Brytella acorum]|uniref:AI-2E family transporter n=1 Tax=Brytella acorum TaxID=2959299 RepID=A0AA35Y283_9PROT|nr:AI-2E family transporter [Brytella acorum]MDF3624553.1 AI-2E family transporter [Brytella acorum]CAI9119598.1 AI-2E family transporter [Brytella acorum]
MTTERIILGLLLVGVAYGCGVILWPFLSAILWAGILTFTTWPLYTRLRRHVSPTIAAAIMMGGSAVAIVLPIAYLSSTGISDIPGLIGSIEAELANISTDGRAPSWLAHIPHFGPELQKTYAEWTHDIHAMGDSLQPYAGQIAHYVLSGLVLLAGGIAELLMALFVALFFWINGDTLGLVITGALTRICGDYADRLILIIGRTIRGTVYGVIGTAIVQGVLTSIGLFLSGVPESVLFGGLAAFLAVFPIGAPLVWIPAALWLVSTHHVASGIFLAAYGVLIISGADHLLRPALISRGAQQPYLLAVLGVLGGVVTLGGLGIFLGPVLLGVGYTLTVEFARGRPPETLGSPTTTNETMDIRPEITDSL